MRQFKERISHQIDATPTQAWELIGAVEGVEQWFASLIKTCTFDNGKRYCETVDGVQFEEHVLVLDHDTKTFQFSIPEQELLPVANIIETMIVSNGTSGKAVIEWSATFDATEENGPIGQEAFRNLWTMGLNEMENFINSKK